tara:strand:- start:554 stop:1456 length:903 start_codon:yes stop_codon:yes gene_type:complete
MKENIKFKIDSQNIGHLTFDLKNEKVNILRSDILKELENKLTLIAKNKKIKSLIIGSNKENNFIAGADINEIKDIDSAKKSREIVAIGQNILSKISKLDIPTIAVIDGSCLGGGTELVLCCDYRLASQNDKTIIGLPEVNLGIIPGFGGTQRLPRLVGIINSLPMILTGKPVNYKKAYRIGLVDGFFPSIYKNEKAIEFAQQIADEKFKNKILARRKKSINKFIENFGPTKQIIFSKAKKNIIAKTKGKYPAPLTALKVIKHTISRPLERGLKFELDCFSQLVFLPAITSINGILFTGLK